MLGQIEANGRDRRQISDRLSHGRRSFRGLLDDNHLGTAPIEPCRCGRRPHHHINEPAPKENAYPADEKVAEHARRYPQNPLRHSIEHGERGGRSFCGHT
jgi:hypothetical protein